MTPLNIITPCICPNNLEKIFQSIVEGNQLNKFSITWYVVFDAFILPKNPLATLEDANIKIVSKALKGGISGNDQRNWAIDQITDGYLYFLDDDNLLHQELLPILSAKIEEQGSVIGLLGNQRLSNRTRTIDISTLSPGCIDTAQFCVHRQLVGKMRWESHYYDADGYFIRGVYEQHYKKFVIVDQVIAHYNKLEAP